MIRHLPGGGCMSQDNFQRIPILNLRLEVSNYLGLFSNTDFCKQFQKVKKQGEPISTVYEDWYGRDTVLISRILRTCIIDIESAVCSAVYLKASMLGQLTNRIKEVTNNPFILPGKSGADRIYNGLPAQIDKKFSLNKMDLKLWKEVSEFYKKIRNPLFHGKEYDKIDICDVKKHLETIEKMFSWLDVWFDLDLLFPSASKASIIPNFERTIDQIVLPSISPNRTRNNQNNGSLKQICIDEVTGMYLDDLFNVQMKDIDNQIIEIRFSPQAAVKLLVYLALGNKQKGWPLPKRL